MNVSALDVLAAFVAINTLMYLVLAVVKMLPRAHLPRGMRRPYARAESRSIYPTDQLALPAAAQVRADPTEASRAATLFTAGFVSVICVVRLTKSFGPT